MRQAVCLFVLVFTLTAEAQTLNRSQLPKLLNTHLGREGTVLIFIGTECPIANKYIPRLNELSEQYAPKGIRFIGYNSNAHETALETAKHARQFEIGFEVLKDVNHEVADYFQAERTPEAILLDHAGKVVYQGRIDDQHNYLGASRPQAGSHDLKNAIEALLADEPIEPASTKVFGCIIARDYQQTAEYTYASHAAEIIQNHCQQCHRPNAVAEYLPWTEYSSIKAMRKMIKEVVVERRMPPWHAHPDYGEFANDRSLPPDEMNALIAWIDAGAPMGDESQVPAPPDFGAQEWTIGEPDRILKIPEPFEVPAQGVVDYQYPIVEEPVQEDLWITHAQVIFDTPAVHHIILYYIPPGGDKSDRAWIVGAAPGDKAVSYPEGFARRVPAGSRFLFELHYTPLGRAMTDRSYVGLRFTDEPPKHEVKMAYLGDPYLDIPPKDPEFSLTRKYHVRKDLYALSFFPHMHYRGKRFRYELVSPNGEKETLLYVPNYDFNWQSNYVLAEPRKIAKGSTIITTATWDNSSENPYNPDPNARVRFGLQSWDEMMFGFMDYYLAEGEPARGRDIRSDENNVPPHVREQWRN